MKTTAPEYKLFSVTGTDSGHWKMTLQTPDDDVRLEVDDCEPDTSGERLALLSVVRGLEALDEPALVEVHTSSVYVREGIRYGLQQWRANDWQWESFGQMVPVKNCDLWQRVDRALCFHKVECHTWRVEPLHAWAESQQAKSQQTQSLASQFEYSSEAPQETETKTDLSRSGGFLSEWKRRLDQFSTRIRYRIATGLQELGQAMIEA